MPDLFDRLKTAVADRYAIEREIGAGGMAIVYLARDLRQGRQVAVKVLRPELAAVVGPERFLREIEISANLNHPHILPLFDSGEAASFLFYVMPHVEGESLRDNLNREKQLSIGGAIEITKAVASALDYAHRHEVIHRDIKPENILLQDGQPVVSDFGIALAVSAAGGTRLTETGLSLGTPQYMSPEQATGDRKIDGRSDIYSLGCVLYEMLAGDPPHTGSTVQAVIAKVVTEKPRPVSELRDTVPFHVEAALEKALAKLPADRFASAAELADALTRPGAVAALDTSIVEARRARPVTIEPAWLRWAIPLALLALAGLETARWIRGEGVAQSGDVTSFTVPVVGGHEMLSGMFTNLTLSPDGRRLVYGARGRLHVRALAGFESEPLAGTEGGSSPFFSPDGQWLGFTKGGILVKGSIDGGPVTEISNATIGGPFGASWSEDGTIVSSGGVSGLWRVALGGEVPEPVTTVLDTALETAHTWPQLLGGGKLVLFTAVGPSALWEDAKIVLKDLETGERTTVVQRGTYGRYVPTGHIVYAQATGTLLAVPFDLARREVTGAPFPVESGVRVAAWGGAASFAISDGGTMAFVRGTTWTNHLLWWVDREGRGLQLGAPLTAGLVVVLSPDGGRVATVIAQPDNADIFLLDAATGERERFTFDAVFEETPVWSPDGRRIAYGVVWPGQRMRIYVKEVDRAAEPTLLYRAEHHLHLTSWSPDGRWLAFDESHPENQTDIYVLKVDSVENVIPVAVTPAGEGDAVFSPDGRWLAYQSDGEVYVVSFPLTGGKQQVSTDGGRRPRWSAAGDELFFWKGDTLMATKVSTQGSFRRETPRPLFELPEVGDYDVTADGQRFLVRVKNPDAPAQEVHVVLNWFEVLREKAGSGPRRHAR